MLYYLSTGCRSSCSSWVVAAAVGNVDIMLRVSLLEAAAVVEIL